MHEEPSDSGSVPSSASGENGSLHDGRSGTHVRLVAVVHLDPLDVVRRPIYMQFARSLAAPADAMPGSVSADHGSKTKTEA